MTDKKKMQEVAETSKNVTMIEDAERLVEEVKAEGLAGQQDDVKSLFERASTNLEFIGKTSDHIRVGKRWDVTHRELRDELIILRQGEIINTKYGPAILAQIDHQGFEKDALLGGMVLFDRFSKLEPHLPLMVVIRKPGKSYIYDDPTTEEIEEYKSLYSF